jgi:hypothetical protein
VPALMLAALAGSVVAFAFARSVAETTRLAVLLLTLNPRFRGATASR